MTARGMPAWLVAVLAFASTIAAAQDAPPPIRPIGRILSAAPDTFGSIEAVRTLSDGRVLVNDVIRRKLELFDPMLTRATTVIDTTTTAARQYPARTTALYRFHGDSSLFLDPAALAMILISPDGRLGRIIAEPPVPELPGAASYLAGQFVSHAQLDGSDRIVFQFVASRAPSTPQSSSAGAFDSLPILRVHLTTHHLDTVATIATARARQLTAALGGRPTVTHAVSPMRVDDDWALLPDGTVAVVHAAPYTVEWISPDGRRTTSKIAHHWEHLADSTKQRMADSLRATDSVSMSQLLFKIDSLTRGAPGASELDLRGGSGAASAGGRAGGAGAPSTGGTPLSAAAVAQVRVDVAAAIGTISSQYLTVADLPDYLPAIYGSSALVDADGNLWLHARLLTPPQGGPVYDVVSRAGRVIDRVQLPGGTLLVGFGKDEVFLSSREGTGVHLVRASIH